MSLWKKKTFEISVCVCVCEMHICIYVYDTYIGEAKDRIEMMFPRIPTMKSGLTIVAKRNIMEWTSFGREKIKKSDEKTCKKGKWFWLEFGEEKRERSFYVFN